MQGTEKLIVPEFYGRTDGMTDRLEIRTLISHPAISRCDNDALLHVHVSMSVGHFNL